MEYAIEFRPQAVKDIDKLSADVARRIMEKIAALRVDLAGDVKRLTNYTPEYRLRVGDWRILFEIVGNRIAIYRVLHRSKAYE